MLKTFRLNTWVKWELDRKLPELVLDPSARGRTGGDLDRVSEAQWMALLDVMGRK